MPSRWNQRQESEKCEPQESGVTAHPAGTLSFIQAAADGNRLGKKIARFEQILARVSDS
jgi:hypothetical protein